MLLTVVKAARGIGSAWLLVDELPEPLPPETEEDEAADELVDEPPALVVPEFTADVVPVVEDACSTVLPVPLMSELEPLLSWVEEDVVPRLELFDVTALTPLVELAVSCEGELVEDPLPPEVVDAAEPCI